MIELLLLTLLQTPQNPSPMTESTRPHPRIAQYEPPGHRAVLSLGTLYVPPTFAQRNRHLLVVHFHGAPWLVEHHVKNRLPEAALVTVQIGAGSRVYADAFSKEGVFTRLMKEAEGQVGALTGVAVRFDRIVLIAFSAGYGAVRSILQHPGEYAVVDAVLLADGLHASYASEAVGPRAADLPVDESSLAPFIALPRDAAAGRKRMIVTHSEVFPGSFASTTETADVLLRHLDLQRQRVLRDGPIGMQNLSEAKRGGFVLLGFAGNSAPDHLDHLYALGDYLGELTRGVADKGPALFARGPIEKEPNRCQATNEPAVAEAPLPRRAPGATPLRVPGR